LAPAWAGPPEATSPRLHEGAIEVVGEGSRAVATVLGGRLGSETVAGVEVGLYVLQAESPERLAPGGRGPTHMFNVTLVDAATGRLLRDATGTVTVRGPGGTREATLRPAGSHHRSLVRLEQEGEYRIQVAFTSGERSGTTRPFPFHYRRKASQGHRCGGGKCGGGK
ncbi:MAG: hypothetical protein D6739_06020, partial [Nitrospirae bacterium]